MAGIRSGPVIGDRVPARLPAGETAPEGLIESFWASERALLDDDADELDRLIQQGEWTLRADAAGVVTGSDRVHAFRTRRGSAPRRRIEVLHVRPVDDDAALVLAVTRTPHGGRGVETQLWRRSGGAWAVAVAHIAPPPAAADQAVWRLVGTPLVPATGAGPLHRATVAVKDLFEIEGERVGAGVREYLAESPRAASTAPAVRALLDAGASVLGIAQTDQFAYSITGANPQYGIPPNPAVPGGLPGGSSSGPAAAVALGQAAIGLGTDTGGSLRVPASYQGLWGLRTTHGAVSREGLVPLAPRFDAVGWVTRDRATLDAAARASLDPERQVPLARRFARAPALDGLAEPTLRMMFRNAVAHLDAREVDLGPIDRLFELFRTVQAAEAWRSHGWWVRKHPGVLARDVAERFEWAATIDAEAERDARDGLEAAASDLRRRLAGRVLLLPSASSTAPQTTASRAEIERIRAATMRLACVAGIAGLPALSIPAFSVPLGGGVSAPAGLSLVGPRFTDLALLRIGAALVDQLPRTEADELTG
ncbi:AtzH-like domain-containing protein [Lysobacter korlensis]|uniref:AtzH-like domain-containing protein n=1 Tax=Lysobacter korlensis TaxID=553636 RepID=A0ABV6RZW7_9GAMM